MRFGHYESWIAFDDRVLKEYDVNVAEGYTRGPALLITHIMSEVGKVSKRRALLSRVLTQRL